MANLIDKLQQSTKTIGTINQGDMAVQDIASFSANNLETQNFTIDGLSEDSYGGDVIQIAFKSSKFKRLKKRLGKRLSLYGKQAVMVDYIGGELFLSLVGYVSYKKVKNKLISFQGYNDNFHSVNGIDVQEQLWYALSQEGVIKRVGYYQNKETEIDGKKIIEPEWVNTEEAITYEKWNNIPIHIFENNEDGTSDIANGNAFGLVQELNWHSNQLKAEVENTKTFTVINKIIAPGTTAKVFKDGQASGVLGLTGPDNLVGTAFSPIQFNPGMITQNLITMATLTDNLYKFTMTFREVGQGGQNKHNSEIAVSNQQAIEYLDFKREIREEDWGVLFGLMEMVAGKPFRFVPVKIGLSKISENLIEATDTTAIAKIQSAATIKQATINANANEEGGEE